jgi:ketosteroid isomerase-like protein
VSAAEFDARDFVERYFASIWDVLNGGVEAMRPWFVDDFQGETPWSTTAPVTDGIEDYARIMARFLPLMAHYEIRIARFHQTADPNTVVVEARGGGQLLGKDHEYWNDIILFITFRNGKMARQKEYFNPTIRPV